MSQRSAAPLVIAGTATALVAMLASLAAPHVEAQQSPQPVGGPAISAADRVYTADQVSNTVSVIYPATGELLGTLALGNPQPDDVLGALYNGQAGVHGLGFSPDGSLLAVINVTSNGVTIVETATNTVRGTVYLGRAPHEGFFTPDGRELWIAVRGQNYVSVIDPVALVETHRIGVMDGVAMVAFRPDGRYAFVDSSRRPVVDVIDTRTYEVVAETPVTSPFSPNILATPDGQEVWLTHKDIGKTTVLDAQTFAVTAVLDTGRTTNHVNFVSNTAGDFAYITVGGEDAVKVFRRGDNPELVATIPTGSTPHGIWPSGDSSRVYVGLEDSDAVQVIDTASNRVIDTIRIGQAPQALVYVVGAVAQGDGRQNLTMQRVGQRIAKYPVTSGDMPFAMRPAPPADAKGTIVVRQLDSVDQLTLMADGLAPDTRYTVVAKARPDVPVTAFTSGPSGMGRATATTELSP